MPAFHRAAGTALLALAATTALARAEVLAVEIEERAEVAPPEGAAGWPAYELLAGSALLGLDPASEANARIADLALAPRGESGLVEARADLVVLQAVDPAERSGTALVEVSNRGRKAALGYLNRAPFAACPSSAELLGDGFLMRRGLTVIWIGWQHDVPDDPELLGLDAPVARGTEGPLFGLARSDWVVEEPARSLPLAHRGHRAHPVSDPADPRNRLTVRDGREAPRRTVPRSTWRFAREEPAGSGALVDDPTSVALDSGFEPGRIYELVYVARDPKVAGVGLAAIRDVLAFAKHDERCPFPVERGVALGISQTGRFLRHFLWEGFNTDERGRKVYDGLLIHSAGAGRGSFDHRFAQPSRDAHRYSAFFFPTDLFPFSGRTQRDELAGREAGLFDRHLADGNAPRVVYTNTGYEYWGRAASLLHTTPDGAADVEPLDCERIYHLASTQHFRVGLPAEDAAPIEGARAWVGDPVDLLIPLRALFVALLDWVERGVEPPPSRFPRVADGTAVAVGELAFPEIPGLATPRAPHVAYRAHYGARWERGIVDVQPPALGPAFPSLVPQVGALGNELAGVPTIETRVPLATYAPWSLRHGLPGETGELRDFYGTFAPLPRTAAEANGDPRPPIDARFASRADFLEAVDAALDALESERWLLAEDRGLARARAAAIWDWIAARP